MMHNTLLNHEPGRYSKDIEYLTGRPILTTFENRDGMEYSFLIDFDYYRVYSDKQIVKCTVKPLVYDHDIPRKFLIEMVKDEVNDELGGRTYFDVEPEII